MNTMTELDLTGDILNVSDITDRIETLIDYCDDTSVEYTPEHRAELRYLTDILTALRGNGGDHKWQGAWYPAYLIRDSHFKEYAIEMLEDCGTIPKDLPSWVEIDWERTANNVQVDYMPIVFNATTYWYR